MTTNTPSTTNIPTCRRCGRTSPTGPGLIPGEWFVIAADGIPEVAPDHLADLDLPDDVSQVQPDNAVVCDSCIVPAEAFAARNAEMMRTEESAAERALRVARLRTNAARRGLRIEKSRSRTFGPSGGYKLMNNETNTVILGPFRELAALDAMEDYLLATNIESSAWTHSERFRKVSNRYPRRVAEAYEGDLAQAMTDDDETVAARVAQWERAEGLFVRDWAAVGRYAEGRESRPVGPTT